MKYTNVFILSIIIIIILLLLHYYLQIPEFKPKVSIVELQSGNLNEKIFLKKKNWGVTGDAQVIVLSESPNKEFEPDGSREFIFKGLSPFFYHFLNDTLNLYVTKNSEIPKNFSSEIVINQSALSNLEMMKLLQNYKEKGLNIIE